MKTIIKLIFWLIVLSFLGFIVYQNLEYFMAKTALILDLKREGWNWTTPGLENIYYFGICFAIGLFIAGFKGLRVKWNLSSIIKSKNKEIDTLQERISHLKTELDVFQHDPYIKKELDKQAAALESLSHSPENGAADNGSPEKDSQETDKEENKEDDKPDTTTD